MTKIKLDSAYPVTVGDALAPYVTLLLDAARAGKDKRILLVGELAPVERTEPVATSDKEPVLKLGLSAAEIPHADQDEPVREVMRALYLQRTATGTLDEEGQIQLTKQALRVAGGQIAHLAAARYRAALQAWATQARAAVHAQLSASEMWHEMERIAEGLAAALDDDEEADINEDD